jgi:general secretion pathway protein C
MQPSAERSSLAERATVMLCTLAAIAVLGCVLAYWTWAWIAPAPEPRAYPAAGLETRAANAGSLFGHAPDSAHSGTQPGTEFKLLGLASASGKEPGYAVLQSATRQILAIRAGDEIAPGILLEEVGVDYVVLARNGTRETLTWPAKGQPARLPRGPAVPHAGRAGREK